MFNNPRILLIVCCISILLLAGCQSESTFTGEGFTFTIPDGWKTMDAIWDRPPSTGEDHYGLGVHRQVMIQTPARKGEGKAFFAVATHRMEAGQTLNGLFFQAYDSASPAVEDLTPSIFELGDDTWMEVTYRRPWGEPWWKFRDLWLEKDGVIYVLSFHASPNSFENYSEAFNQILDSFQFVRPNGS